MAESLRPQQLNHIALPTANPERGAEFYCEVLGFRLVPRPAFSFDGRWLYREDVGAMIHLIHAEGYCPPAGPMNTRGYHFAMQSSDVDRDLELLAAHGVETVERVLPTYGYRQVFFQDPDGNVIEIGEWPAVDRMVLE